MNGWIAKGCRAEYLGATLGDSVSFLFQYVCQLKRQWRRIIVGSNLALLRFGNKKHKTIELLWLCLQVPVGTMAAIFVEAKAKRCRLIYFDGRQRRRNKSPLLKIKTPHLMLQNGGRCNSVELISLADILSVRTLSNLIWLHSKNIVHFIIIMENMHWLINYWPSFADLRQFLTHFDQIWSILVNYWPLFADFGRFPQISVLFRPFFTYFSQLLVKFGWFASISGPFWSNLVGFGRFLTHFCRFFIIETWMCNQSWLHSKNTGNFIIILENMH